MEQWTQAIHLASSFFLDPCYYINMPLTMTSLSVATSRTTFLNEVNAVLMEGERVGLTGANGSGKSTLLQILLHGDDHNNNNASLRYWNIASGSIRGSLSPRERPRRSALVIHQEILSWSSLFLPFSVSEDDEEGDDGDSSCQMEQDLRDLTISDALDLAMGHQGNHSAMEDQESWRRMLVAAGQALH